MTSPRPEPHAPASLSSSTRTGQVLDAATELSAAIRPVIEHLPAISAALRDAAYYRHLDAQECSSGHCRNDRAAQQTLADAYTTAPAAVAP